MKLPQIPKKNFTIKSKYLPKGSINLTPFNVGQETVLLQVKDSTDKKEKISGIKQIVEECILNKDINVTDLPLFLIEEIFLRLRQNSIGEIISLTYECTNEVNGETCKNVMPMDVDLRDFKIKEEEGHTNKVIISDPIGIKFKYPSITTYEDSDSEEDIDTILECIDVIFDESNVYNSSEYDKTQLLEFWNQLTLLQKKDIYDKFFLSMPHMHYKNTLTCKKCGHIHPIEFNSALEVFQ